MTHRLMTSGLLKVQILLWPQLYQNLIQSAISLPAHDYSFYRTFFPSRQSLPPEKPLMIAAWSVVNNVLLMLQPFSAVPAAGNKLVTR